MDSFFERDLPRLTALVYDAALDQTLWPKFLEALPYAFDDARGILRFAKKTSSVTHDMPFNCDPDYLKSYASYFGAYNPYTAAHMATMRVGEVSFVSSLIPAEQVEGSEYYHEWMVPQGITADHMACSLFREGDDCAIIGLAPHTTSYRRDRQLYSNCFQLLAPHLVRAIALNHQLAASKLVEQALGSSLDALGTAAFVLAPAGRLLHANRLGEGMLRAGDVVALKRGRVLAAKSAAEATALEVAIRDAAYHGTSIGAPIRLASRGDGAAHLAWVFQMREPADPSSPRSPLRLLDALDRDGAILVLITRSDRTAAISAGVLRSAYGLSVAEALLAEALVAGKTLAEYGAIKGLSRNTLRNQLASIFDKTGTNRQAELVARVLATLGPFAGGQ